MRILLDESLPRQLQRLIPSHEVRDVHGEGWTGKTNGELLKLAAKSFDAFFTADQNLRHQQRISAFDLRVVVLAGRTNRLADLEPLMPPALEALAAMNPGELRQIP